MPESDHSPRDARRLRDFGRRRAPDDPITPSPVSDVTVADQPVTTPLSPGSIWGPESAAPPPAPPEPEPTEPAPTELTPPEPTSAKHRRRAGERPRDPDSVDIEADGDHAWWAQRDNLENVVNPKKRGAAARAQRAAREAFAPAGARHAAAGAQQVNHAYTWDPADVYNWTTPTSSGPPHASQQGTGQTPPFDPAASPHLPYAPTPWDVLGLTSEATWTEVSHRHKQLAKEHHPDRHMADGGDIKVRAEARMAEINAAFSDLRRIYRLTDST